MMTASEFEYATRGVMSWPTRVYGPDAVRDLAEELAADMAEAVAALAAAQGATRWTCSRAGTGADGAAPPVRRSSGSDTFGGCRQL
jgi:hypothetical protein